MITRLVMRAAPGREVHRLTRRTGPGPSADLSAPRHEHLLTCSLVNSNTNRSIRKQLGSRLDKQLSHEYDRRTTRFFPQQRTWKLLPVIKAERISSNQNMHVISTFSPNHTPNVLCL